MAARPIPRAPISRSVAWRSVAESEAPFASSTRIKHEPRNPDETEAAIQASLSAALQELDQLELGPGRPAALPPEPALSKGKPLRFAPKVPRGMPTLPGGRRMPPLPVLLRSTLDPIRRSLTPFRKSLEPLLRSKGPATPTKPVATAPAAAPAAVHVVESTTLRPTRPAEPPPIRRWPGVVAAVLGTALVGAGLWLSLATPSQQKQAKAELLAFVHAHVR